MRRFGRFMLMHDAGAAASPVSAVVNAMPGQMATRVSRTLPVFFERDSGLKIVATEQILVRFRPGATGTARRKLLASIGLAVVRASEFDARRQIVAPVSVRRASRALDLANQLAEADDLVEFAAPNFLAEVTKPRMNDPRFGSQWHLRNTGRLGGVAHEDVDAAGAWKIAGGGSPRTVIAIIDDGVDIDHPDLKPNIWKNPRRGARDRHGRDFVDDTDRWNPRPKVFNPPFDDTESNDIHGTPCAGVAAGAGNNRRGVTGIAWRCKLLAVKIMAGPTLAPFDRIADSIRYAARHADVLSCSWGVARHPDVESALADATTRGRRGRGAPVFVATGNEFARRIGFPSSDERALAVGASNDRGRRSGLQQLRARHRLRGAERRCAPAGDHDDRRPSPDQGLRARQRLLRRLRRHVVGHAAGRGHRGADALGEPVAALERGWGPDEIHRGSNRRGQRELPEELQRPLRLRPRQRRRRGRGRRRLSPASQAEAMSERVRAEQQLGGSGFTVRSPPHRAIATRNATSCCSVVSPAFTSISIT